MNNIKYNSVAEKVLNSDGIRTRTFLRNRLRKPYNILKDLSKKWNKIEKPNQKVICIVLAGAKSAEELNALLNHIDVIKRQ